MSDEITIGIDSPSIEQGAIMNIASESPESDDALMSVDGENDGDNASVNIDADQGESGYETEVVGDENLKEDLKEPRDNYDHFADHTFHNNVTIAGTFRTKRWIHPHGCMFHSIRELYTEYPDPVRGMWAWVGTGFPSKVWICEEDGIWKEADCKTLDRDTLDTILQSYATRKWVTTEINNAIRESAMRPSGSSTDYAKYADKAGYADLAGDLSEDSEVFKRFLSRKNDDTAEGLITFLKGLVSRELSRFKGGAEFGEFVSGMMTGFGGAIDSKGNAEVESLIVRSTMQVMELIINRIGAQEGDTLFSESDTIETLTDNGDGTWLLKLKSKYDGYFTAMTAGMVIKGVINDLASGGTDYYTSWMRVNSVNASANTIEVSIYPDSEVPAGRNFPPCELMKLVRWGHQTDTKKQSIFYISSTEGRIVKLTRVDRPIIDFSNYEISLGTFPERISELKPIALGESGLYAKHIVTEAVWYLDHQGRPLPTIRDRGPYDPAEKYYSGDTVRPETNDWEQSDVWYLGCRWRCMVTGTARAPAWNVTDWAFIEGNPEFRVELLGAPTAIRPRNFKFTLRVKATLYNADVTADILDSDIEWTRYTEDSDGNQRVSSDNAWAIKHASAAKEITLTQDDLDILDGVVPPVARFIVSVRLRDGKEPVSAVFGYRV